MKTLTVKRTNEVEIQIGDVYVKMTDREAKELLSALGHVLNEQTLPSKKTPLYKEDNERRYLIRVKGNQQKAHLWIGNDTACKMWSTNGIKKSRYRLHDSTQGKEVCLMCMNNILKEPHK